MEPCGATHGLTDAMQRLRALIAIADWLLEQPSIEGTSRTHVQASRSRLKAALAFAARTRRDELHVLDSTTHGGG